jgi:4-aminobutyrate aminotransferase-like enzyme
MDAWPQSSVEALHTSTFLGNPLGCAMALASLREHVKPETAARVRESGQHLRVALHKNRSPRIGNVRGAGLLVGVELVDSTGAPDPGAAAHVVQESLRRGLLLLSGGRCGNVLSLTPPFALSKEEADFFGATLDGILSAY